MAAARPAPDVYPSSGSLAAEPRLNMAPFPKAQAAEGVPEPVARRAPYQPALFPTRDLGRVVPIESYKQRAAERRERAKEAESAAAHQRKSGPPESAIQTDLPFSPTASNPAQRGISEARYSKAPVAIPVHRLMAAAIDFAMVTVVAGILAVAVDLGARDTPLPGQPLYWFGGLGVALAIAYKLFWAAIDSDSPGLRWSQLKLLHFDGRTPSRTERAERIAWSMMSILAGGLGLLWSVVDEESLSWHDHSSKTFLTPFSGTNKVR